MYACIYVFVCIYIYIYIYIITWDGEMDGHRAADYWRPLAVRSNHLLVLNSYSNHIIFICININIINTINTQYILT